MSDRGFGAGLETELSSENASLAFLVFLDWPGGAGRFWTGVGPLTYDSQTWAGAGNLGHIDKVGDSLDKSDIGVELTLNYLDDAIRNEVVTNDPVGRDASIYLAVIDESTKSVTEAYEVFPGFIDEVEILDSGESGAIKVRLASELARMSRPTWFQLSNAHQQDLFPADKGMEFVSQMDQPIFWGRKPTNPRGGGGAGERDFREDRR